MHTIAPAIGVLQFETAIGPCGLAWGARGIVAIRLLVDRLGTSDGPPAPPPEIIEARGRLQALLAGEDVDLGALTLDMARLDAFDRDVYRRAQAIPRGTTRTYGAIAKDLGDPLLARDVGQALGRNPFPLAVPCHRVIGAGEKLVGFSAPGGLETKRRLLAIEGVFPGGPTLFDHFGVAAGSPR